MNKPQQNHTALTAFTAIVLIAALGVSAMVGPATVGAQSETGEYSVIQGGECIMIEPLGYGHRSAEEFYDYRTPDTDPSAYSYSSHGTTHLQEEDTSTLLLHEGSDGLSLVFLHDQYQSNSSGGAVTMQLNNLPAEGTWTVEDDSYEGHEDVFDHQETSSRITWVWDEERNDGAVFTGGLDTGFEIEIIPGFNDQADFSAYDGEISDWQVLSGTGNDPERMSLAMDEPIVIQSGGCNSLDVTDVSMAETAAVGEPIDVEVTAENGNDEAITSTMIVTADGEQADRQDITLDPGETTSFSTSVTFDEAGTHTVGVDGETAEVTVEETAESSEDSSDSSEDGDDGDTGESEMPGFGVTAVAVAVVLGTLLARRRL